MTVKKLHSARHDTSPVSGVLTIYSEKPEIPVGKTNGMCHSAGADAGSGIVLT